MNGPALAYTAIAASANVIGAAAVVAHSRWSVRALENMVALSAGFMVSVALLDLAPDAIKTQGESAALVILIGYLLVHLTQHTTRAALPFRRRGAPGLQGGELLGACGPDAAYVR